MARSGNGGGQKVKRLYVPEGSQRDVRERVHGNVNPYAVKNLMAGRARLRGAIGEECFTEVGDGFLHRGKRYTFHPGTAEIGSCYSWLGDRRIFPGMRLVADSEEDMRFLAEQFSIGGFID